MPALFWFAACIGLDKLTPAEVDQDETVELGALQIGASDVDFGTVQVGSSAEEAIVVSNTGSAPIALTASLDDAGVFSISSTSLEITGDTSLTLGFTPDDADDYVGALTLTIETGDTLELPVIGTGTIEGDTDTSRPDDTGDTDEPTNGPSIDITPGSHDFGAVDLGDTSVVTFVVSNVGTDDLLVTDVETSHGVFTTGGTLSTPQVISPGYNKTVEVSFEPDAETTWLGSLTLSSDDPRTPELVVTIEGEGVDRCDVCAPIIDVDTGGTDPYAISDFVSLFGSTDTRTVTIQNIGDQDLTVDDILVNNDSLSTCGSFSIGGWSSSTVLGPWDTDTFTISYQASASCLEVPLASFDENVVHILSDDPSQDDWVIELSGAGVFL